MAVVKSFASNYLSHIKKDFKERKKKEKKKVSIHLIFSYLQSINFGLIFFVCSLYSLTQKEFLLVFVFIVLVFQSYHITILYYFLLSKTILKGS